ncbi:MAG TPA: efflux RND transporter periplasmic adaptor subunit [Mucilaginibacter sp.]|nr:efflux RND transporter periplasmic adaptor subunit [Mucilaginibacter sp.]
MKQSLFIWAIFITGMVLSYGCSQSQNKTGNEMDGMGMGMNGMEHKDTLNLSSVLKPSNEFVLSSISTITLTADTITPAISSVGNVAYDMRKVGIISSLVSGRIDRLYTRYRYQEVHKGERVMDIYSPELLTAQQNLLFLLKNDPGNKALIDDAMQRLLLLGMSNKQLTQLAISRVPFMDVPVYSNYDGHIHDGGDNSMNAAQPSMNAMPSDITPLSVKEGAYIQKGQPVFDVYNPGKSWILLSIYPDDQNKISTGDRVDIIPEASSEEVIHGTINYVEPFFRSNTRTLTARVYFDNSKMKLPIGSQVKATIYSRPITANTLPETAIVSLGLNQVVFKKVKEGFKAIKVVASKRYNGRVAILAGLTSADTIAANGQFLMDSESFIKINKQ